MSSVVLHPVARAKRQLTPLFTPVGPLNLHKNVPPSVQAIRRGRKVEEAELISEHGFILPD